MSTLDARALAAMQPVGPDRAADTSLTTVGKVLAVDPDTATVLVSVHGSDGSWIPAVAGRYIPGGACRVLLDPWQGGRSVTVLGPVDTRSPVTLATLQSTNETANRATIQWDGKAWVVPFIPAVYAAGTQVWAHLDDWGRPVLVEGPSDDAPPPPAPAAAAPAAAAATAVTTTTIFAQWSGTYRSVRDGFDRWNVDRYGGRSTLYQGDGFGSGPLKGLAVYGDQLANLGATSIDRLEVMLRSVGLTGASGPATVQGSPHGATPGGAPASSGETATGDGWVELPAGMREGFRTGAIRGLALVGGPYWAVAGAGNGDGMAMRATYRRAV